MLSVALPDENRQQAKLDVTDYLANMATNARQANPNIEYHLTGELILNRAMRDAINDGMSVLAPIAVATMLLVAVVLLRSLWGTVAIVVMLVTVISSATGFVGWTGMRFFGESGAAVFVLMALTVAHSVHIIEGVFAGLRQNFDRKDAAIYSIKVNIWPVFLTSLTTAIGFLSLNFSGMPPFQVLGNMVAFGAMAAFVFSVTLLPVFLAIVPIQGPKVREAGLDIFDRIGRFIVLHRTTLFWSSLVVIIVAVAGLPRIQLHENWLEILTEKYEFRKSTDFISENFPGVETYEYSLDSGTESGVTNVEYLNKVDSFANWYREQPEVAQVFAISDIIKRLNKNLSTDLTRHLLTVSRDFRVGPASAPVTLNFALRASEVLNSTKAIDWTT